RRHTRFSRDWSSDVCSSDLYALLQPDDSRRESRGVVAVVADGASCSEEARLASQTAVLTFIQDYMSTPDSWDVKTSASRVLSARSEERRVGKACRSGGLRAS